MKAIAHIATLFLMTSAQLTEKETGGWKPIGKLKFAYSLPGMLMPTGQEKIWINCPVCATSAWHGL